MYVLVYCAYMQLRCSTETHVLYMFYTLTTHNVVCEKPLWLGTDMKGANGTSLARIKDK